MSSYTRTMLSAAIGPVISPRHKPNDNKLAKMQGHRSSVSGQCFDSGTTPDGWPTDKLEYVPKDPAEWRKMSQVEEIDLAMQLWIVVSACWFLGGNDCRVLIGRVNSG
ncbi:hypothetical protein PISL3812_06782 [Talaromyces islandicus]|uniref:Uncharacterized protein n=1 Tax=Talaromyces islandicus TaxID=28573 RepID=A0A0U1M2D6_TALIS|nr:hypothetical protein PISL3812_06782 [Talaromyces islandicus]